MLNPTKSKVFMGQNLIWVMILLGQLHGYKSCIQKERSALFEVKKYMISVAKEGKSNFVYPTWTNDTKSDCCRWEDVKCNRSSGRVIEISFGHMYTKENSFLNLSLLHPFEEVRSLDLSWSGFSGLFDAVEGFKSLRRLRNLEILDFTANNFNRSIFPFVNAATSLRKLYLLYNNMDGHVPFKELRDLTNLELLDMSENRLNDSIPIQVLHLITPGICNLKNLQELDLAQNKLVGDFPLCLTSMMGLRVLDLSLNQLTGTLPSSLGNLKSLEYLSLFDNNFEGFFSLGSLANLSVLRVLKFSSQSNSFQVVSESSWKPKFQLSIIDLRSCNLKRVPHFLLHQNDLRHVDLSDNKIAENFPSWLLANNSKLEVLLLQNNSFVSFQLPDSAHNLFSLDLSMNEFSNVFPQNIGWILPHLQYMNIAKNSFQGNLPASLGNMKSIHYLDISHNSFHGTLPKGFIKGCYSISILKLSHNKLSGEVFPETANFTYITVLSMDNNSFTGEIRNGLRTLTSLLVLDISDNNLTGVIPSWIGEFELLSALLLSNNSLEGEIPISLFNIPRLGLLDLSANMLSGDIPPPHVNSSYPVVLLLQDNNFSNDIPHSLLQNVSILDMRNNRLSGNIPEFISSQNINILLLRGNNFTGGIPHQLCGLSNIHLLDLANNGLSGSIPSCLSNISFGSGKKDRLNYYNLSIGYSNDGVIIGPSMVQRGNNVGAYFKSLLLLEEFSMNYMEGVHTKIEFATKYRYDAYMGGNLLELGGLDLSHNELSGEIPVELGESLDLSFNRLQGEIPRVLAELSSLAVFNVSYNNLSGVIPQGRQFNTFDIRSYLGNPLLCGKPTNISCDGNNFQDQGDNEVESVESTSDMVSFYWSLTVAYVTIFLGILASLSFDSSWSRAWFYMVDAFIHKVRNFLINLYSYKIYIPSTLWFEFLIASFILLYNIFFAMGVKMCLCQNLIWVMLLMGQLHGYESCVEKDRNGLLELKNYLISQSIEGESNSVLPTWSNDTKSDCCLWEGLKCSGTSKRVTEIAFGGLKLRENTLLNLSLLHPFEDVQSLNLSSNQYNGLFDDVEGYNSLRKLTKLEILDLTSNEFNNSIFPFLNAATSLTTLFLRSNNMDGSLPVKDFRDLTNLELLDLSRNRFNGSIPLQGICELKNIQELDLSHNKLVGQFPLCLTSLSGLRVLDLSSNQITGRLPPSLGSLTSLEYLSLFDNDFEGFFSLGSLTNLTKLRVLKLCSQSNSLQLVSDSSWKPKFQLDVIALRSCNFDKVPQFLLHQKELRHVDLSDNNIYGKFPSWLLQNNTKLKVLLLQKNSFTTFQLPESPHHLLFMDLSVNKLNHLLPENIGWILPHLRYMNISNNGFLESLPSSLGNMKSIEYMDLSHNSFHGELPRSFLNGCDSMAILKLSHNKLTGEIFQEPPKFTNILGLFMDNNLFTGKVGQGLQSLRKLSLLDMSNNNLTGVVPSWIGKLPSLTALLIANNLLEGNIPTSLFNNTNLQLLDLSTNSLSGGLPPQHNSKNGVVLLLQDNDLSGEISYTQLANVEILDLRNNRLSGSIPEFIRTQNISVLLLRGNNLTGRIPHQLCGLINIQLLDLSRNRLNGSIPSCLSNTSFVTGKRCTSYDYDFGISFPSDVFDGFSLQQDGATFKSLLMLDPFSMDYKASTQTKIEFATKYRYDSYMGKNLKLLYGLDLSENELSGEIPAEFGELMELRAFNLSHNNLSGAIPESFSGMKNVESLDISFNRLQGRIPQELTQLSTLSVFKVSYNNLSGAIPQGTQFSTFDTQSFVGNNLLCGQPTSRSCNTFQEPNSGEDDDNDDEFAIDMESFYWSFAAAYVTILVGLFASLSFDSPWSRFWFEMVDGFINKLHGYKSCIEKERKALLDLKEYLISTSQTEDFDYVLPTWSNDTKSNCCLWEGVKCNRTSRWVTEIAFGDLYLKEHSLLNLSLLHPFDELRSLDLSQCAFSAMFDDMEGYKSLSRLRSLEILDLSSNQFNNSIFPFLNAATSLTTLFLRYNYMNVPFPVKELKSLTNLELLDLSGNEYNGSMPVLCEMKNLQELYLSGNDFVGQLPLCLGSLKKLRILDLSYNILSGNLSSSFSSLESLEYLSLSDNNFEGLFSLNPLANLTNLKVFKLSSESDVIQVDTESTWVPKFQLTIAALPFCGLEKIPNFLMYQKKLRVLDLSSNRISGNIPTWLLANNPELEVLQLQNNSFTLFQIPKIVRKLQFLDFSANDIGGVLPDYFGHVLPSLLHLNGTHNELQGNLPSSMGEMKNISFLDLSHNKFSGELPRSLFTGCVSLQILLLSHNQLGGHILPGQTNLTSLIVLRIDNNLFTGEIGRGFLTLVNLSVLDASNNRLTGAIPSWIPEESHIIMLLLSNNLLEGTLPPSLLAVYHLEFLDLSGNLLSGELPSSHLNSMYGISMFLQNNSLTGQIPVKLLENAKILDLRKNKFSGSIPQFVNTGEMRIFLLKGNNLTGSIPWKLCDMRNITLLDLSDNKLNGTIPSCLYNLTFGSREEEEMTSSSFGAMGFGFGERLEFEFYKSTFLVEEFMTYYDTYMIVEIQFAAKQRYDSYIGGTLDYMYGLDLSSNELSGVIPAELGELSKLRAMNLSRNFLSSSIPDSFSKLKDIESLDLSYNMLHGNIPNQLTNLTSLAVFNVSYNNLSGIIPQGRQFSTFNENSYLGNPLLCGPPTDRSCEAKKSTKETDNVGEEEEDDEAVVDMMVFYWTTASTYVTALIGFLLLMCIDCPWRQAWLRLVDAFTASVKRMFS
ncbi:unnamed protein product [Eruca vesicaria subsp. sativa]|uniref:Leucine-rich repeat-containing N-terminal plant-type domain-containing protein n=1 Tax=Eruca vesicaria subsp. sativa TaxID=29727 RepID=A0ABC8JNE4_ERUVS|nr:unnamed protein product [Eruca vesicaria subsp. sativa]